MPPNVGSSSLSKPAKTAQRPTAPGRGGGTEHRGGAGDVRVDAIGDQDHGRATTGGSSLQIAVVHAGPAHSVRVRVIPLEDDRLAVGHCGGTGEDVELDPTGFRNCEEWEPGHRAEVARAGDQGPEGVRVDAGGPGTTVGAVRERVFPYRLVVPSGGDRVRPHINAGERRRLDERRAQVVRLWHERVAVEDRDYWPIPGHVAGIDPVGRLSPHPALAPAAECDQPIDVQRRLVVAVERPVRGVARDLEAVVHHHRPGELGAADGDRENRSQHQQECP